MTKVREIMSKDCKYIESNSTIQEAAKIMKDRDIGFIPVGDHDKIVGIITDRDIVTRGFTNGNDIKTTTVTEAMTPKCLYCYEEDTVEEASSNMAKNKVRRLPVLNSDKRLVGVISLGDICSKGSKQSAGEALSFITQKAS